MLTGYSLPQLMKEVKDRFEMDWKPLWFTPSKSLFRAVSRFIIRKTGADPKLASILRVPYPARPGKSAEDIPSTGRGMVIIAKDNITSHAVAYEDGVIFDPACPHLMSYDTFLRSYPGWVILHVVPIETFNNQGDHIDNREDRRKTDAASE
jgi:hypothetical protein